MLHYLDTAIGFAVIMLLLSLLVTSLVQTTIALFNMRGRNLRWGLELLLEQCGIPKEVGTKLSDEILRHPAIASTGFLLGRRQAVAIRVEELYRLLDQYGQSLPKGHELKSLFDELPPEAARIEKLATDLAQAVPVTAATLRAGMAGVFAQQSELVAGVNQWFDTVMDRTSQRFTMHTRWLSVAGAVVLTVALRLDTPAVLNRIWSNAALREQLVSVGAPAALRMADSVQTYQNTQRALATLAIGQVGAAQQDTALKRILGAAPSNLATLQQGADWLAGALKGRKDSVTVLTAYRDGMAVQADSLLGRYARTSRDVRSALADTAIGIFQTPFPKLGKYWWNADHAVRGLISIVLLSLGAPFWFKALKQAANLRPALAQKVEEESRAKGA
jgi:hypothetical protein